MTSRTEEVSYVLRDELAVVVWASDYPVNAYKGQSMPSRSISSSSRPK